MKSKLKVLLLTLFLISCKNEVQKNVIDENFCSDELEIIIDENRIVINKEGNFGTLETNQKTQPKLFKLTKNETNILFSEAFKLITLKEYTIHTKSCYAGQKFTLRLNCIDKSIEFHQLSVESWSKISKETKGIYSILKNKTKIEE
ncbi:hypothetical protein [Flavobacterium sp.]|jgi:hypothetical protein|uniref:hypothetical protein n=1 Tax=Flavobacterium sp. TaxID=239 RepID=UPI0037C0CA93